MLGWLVAMVSMAMAFLTWRKARRAEAILEFAHARVGRMRAGDFTSEGSAGEPGDSRLVQSLEGLRQELSSFFRALVAVSTSVESVRGEIDGLVEQNEKDIGEISGEADSLASAVQDASKQAGVLSGAAEELSSRLSSAAAAVEEMDRSVETVSGRSALVAEHVREAGRRSREAAEIVNDLASSTREIESFLGEMSEIADQTKLLALNATIEAARAGEMGKGFAVVAGEVKNLALKSSNAANHVSKLVETIQTRVQSALESMRTLENGILQVEGTSSEIAVAMDQQAAATKSIAFDVAAMADGQTGRQGLSISSLIQASADTTGTFQSHSLSVKRVCDRSSIVIVGRTRVSAERLAGASTGFSDLAGKQRFEAPFDLRKIKAAHIAWVNRLQGVLTGSIELRPEQVSDHTMCDLGKWYFGPEGTAMKSHAGHTETGLHHENVHRSARRVVEMVAGGRMEEAHRAMKDFEDARQNLFLALDRLYVG